MNVELKTLKSYKMLDYLRKKADPFNQPAGSMEVFANEDLPELLSQGKEILEGRDQRNIHVANSLSVIDWLENRRNRTNQSKGRFTPATIHHYLEYFISFEKKTPDRLWIEVIDESRSPEILLSTLGRNLEKSEDMLSCFRSYYAYHKNIGGMKDFPASIQSSNSLKLKRPKRLPVPKDIDDLIQKMYQSTVPIIGENDTGLLADLFCIFIHLSFLLALRNVEVLELQNIDVTVTDHITVTVLAKGGKIKIKESIDEIPIPTQLTNALRKLTSDRRNRFDPIFEAFTHAFPENKKLKTHGDVYRMLLGLLEELGHEDGTHCLRRLWANLARAVGIPPLVIIHFLGHSIAKTFFESYIQILPKLQEERLLLWSIRQKNIIIPGEIKVNSLLANQGISKAGFAKQLDRTGHTEIRGKKDISIIQANDFLRSLIREVQTVNPDPH